MESRINKGRWTKREKKLFEEAYNRYGKEWKLIASIIGSRTVIQIRTHAQKYFQKIAKLTGTCVMSTSKKDTFYRQIEATERHYKRMRVNRVLESVDNWVGSSENESEESDDENRQDNLTEAVKAYMATNSMNMSREIMAATATLLLAPKYKKIDTKTLDWAKKTSLLKLNCK